MEHYELMQTLNSVALGISKLLGDDTEVVIHDIDKGEIEFIANGYITGREVGYQIDDSLYKAILNYLDADGHSVGYRSHTAKGRSLRSSHFLIRDDENKPKALICINQDTSKLEEVCGVIQDMIRTKPLNEAESFESADDNYIMRITQKIIIDTIEKSKPTKVKTKEKKLEILRTLDNKGVFTVKDAIPIVCRTLSISQATLYNYLRELRSEEVPSFNKEPLML